MIVVAREHQRLPLVIIVSLANLDIILVDRQERVHKSHPSAKLLCRTPKAFQFTT